MWGIGCVAALARHLGLGAPHRAAPGPPSFARMSRSGPSNDRVRSENALAAYGRMKREGHGAAGAFEELAARYPDDPLIAFHAKRLAASVKERRQKLRVSGCTIIMGEK